MSTLTEEKIRLRAYALWEAAGQPDGQSSMDVFWYEAEKQLLAEKSEQDSTLMDGAPIAPI